MPCCIHGRSLVLKIAMTESGKCVFGDFDQVRFKPACSASETSQNLEPLDRASIHIILSKQRTIKVMVRLRGCAG